MISRRVRQLRPSGIRQMFERAASFADPIDLSIGQPHFEVPEIVQEAAIRAIRGSKNRYTVTQGIPDLNEKLADRLAQTWGRRPERTLVTSGVSGGLLLSYLCLLDPGDEILLPEPYFVLYQVLADVVSAVPRYYDVYPDFRLTRERLEQNLSERTKVLLLNSPSNPTGAVYSAEELKIAAQFARDHNLAVISDEIYEAFEYDGRHRSVAEFYDRSVVLSGFSKTYAMPGWRLGFAAGPEDLLEPMITLQQFTFVCANSPSQHAGVVALDVDMSSMVDEYRGKRDRVCDAISDCYDLVRPGGSFYVFPRLPEGVPGSEFVEHALERQLLVVPGTAFSARDTHFRISFAAHDSTLDKGIEALRALAEA